MTTTMKAEIKTYQTNATIYYCDHAYNVNWDGAECESQAEYNDWISDWLEPIADADNYNEIRTKLEIATDHLRPTIGEMLRHLRIEQGVTQTELAEKLGIKQPTLARMESGRVSINESTLTRILDALNLQLQITSK